MRKLLALILMSVLVLAAMTTALAEPFYLEVAGVTIDVPEGMTAQDMSSEEAYVLAITVDADENLRYAYSLQYIEPYAGLHMGDLSEEDANVLIESIANVIVEPQFETVEVDGYIVLVVASGDGTQLHYITLMGGWFCDLIVGRADGTVLSEEDIQPAAQMLLGITFETDAQAEEETVSN